ncbi:MAG: cation:proton antiporter [Bryobacteraceae bacterium]
MSEPGIGVDALLAIGLLSFLFTAAGLLLTKNLYDQIHYLAPGALIGSIAIPAAVVAHEGLSQAGAKAILIAILLVCANPVLSHAIARAGRIRRKGQWPPVEGEQIPVAPEESES